ncbi:spermidine synthase [Gandjariella thermophila]|uniref:spermine/spermidine synthase domain-containing protein n=1 Tax=Gandjariella thermophila TaxID=1931992 RepID=UPI001CEF9582|nr:spermidine synthase [Gandjariella thermophila]
MDGGRWLCEPIRPDVADLWRLDEVRYEGKTPYQRVLIARTRLGVTLFCDDNPQSAECGQLAFHEAELVPAMLLAERVRRVLVIGCGEGTVCQIAAEAGAEHVDHVDIDPDCVWACARHLPYGYDEDQVRAAERGEGPIRLHYADGGQFVLDALRSGTRYDVVVLDLPEEQDGSETGHNALYGTQFLACCRDLLTPGGVVATHVSRPYLSLPTADSVGSFVRPWRRFAEVFGTRVYFRSDEQPWGTIMLGRADTVADPVRRMIDRLPALRYRPATIDAPMLTSATHLPAVLRGG